MGHGLDLSLDLRDIIKSAHRLLKDGKSLVMLHYLGQIAYGHIVGLVDASGGRTLKTTDELEDSGLAGTVLADKTYLVSLAYMEIYLVQQHKAAVRHRNILYRNHLLKIILSKYSGL